VINPFRSSIAAELIYDTKVIDPSLLHHQEATFSLTPEKEIVVDQNQSQTGDQQQNRI
jgi:hypothetical protein